MGSVISIVEETPVEGTTYAPIPAEPLKLPLEQPQPHPQVVQALKSLADRTAALEMAIQGVPKAAGIIRALLKALGARALMFVALIGCLGLAVATALSPSWPGLSIFGSFSVLVYLPLAYLASRGN